MTLKTWVTFGYMLLKNIEANKLRIVKYYNKKVKSKQFSKGYLSGR